MSLPSSRPWTVIVPVKASVRAKSRIRLDPAVRRTLALIMAEDTVSAIVGVGLLLVASVLYALEAGGPALWSVPVAAWVAGVGGLGPRRAGGARR